MLENLPYAIATLCQTTIAVMLSCTLILPHLTKLVERPFCDTLLELEKKAWPDSSLGSDTASDYSKSEAASVIKAPLPVMQASMVTPAQSRHGSATSLASSSSAFSKESTAPARPPPPFEHQRPDMQTFIQRPAVLMPQPAAIRSGPKEQPSESILGWNYDDVESGRTPQHVRSSSIPAFKYDCMESGRMPRHFKSNSVPGWSYECMGTGQTPIHVNARA